MTKLHEHLRRYRAPKHFVLAGVFVLAVLVTLIGVQTARADGRILANVSVGSVDIGGLTPAQAQARLRDSLRAVNAAGFNFTYGEKTVTLQAAELNAINPSPIGYDIAGMADEAFAYGHEGGLADLALANFRAKLSNVMIQPRVTIDREEVKKLLVSRFGGYENKRHDADIAVTKVPTPVDESASGTPPFHYEISILPESKGTAFNYDTAIEAAANDAMHWQGADISLSLVEDNPVISSDRAAHMRDAILATLQRGELNLAYDDQKWPIDGDFLASALTLKVRPDGSPYLGLRAPIADALFDTIAGAVNSAAQPTKMTLLPDGKVDQDTFVGGEIGKTLSREATLALLEERMVDTTVRDVPIVVDTSYPQDSDPVAADLGIRELLGYGTSNYAGSPKNRIKNIANGARLLGGTVIKPGEQFSLLGALRPFTTQNGYLPELVIKEKRTVPEVGGGLCQIGTTTFRATMASGLPVTQRQNHSYRVRYYEPAGTDATIYEPNPDFRFTNDTGNHIVVITKVLPNSKLRFEFWGTRDGRIQTQSPVRMWNETQPPPPKLIETSELAPGKQKCFEIAHPGATTEFTYTITYSDGHVENKVFHSVYKPWQQQCLVGTANAAHIVVDKDGSIKELPPKPGDAIVTIAPGIDAPASN